MCLTVLHFSFYFRDRFWGVTAEIQMPIAGDQNIIFDPYADVPEFFRHMFCRAHVDARLYRNDHACL